MKPPLKWAGGKRWLVPILKEIWEPYNSCRLVEPFTGGMAVALGLMPNTALLNDANIHLVNFYTQIQQGLTITNRFRNDPDYYYSMRKRFNDNYHKGAYKTPEAAAIFYYLIKTGFNGLCRFNNKGEFNVPFGRHASITYLKKFPDYSEILSKWTISNCDFESLDIDTSDFIYADPPYDVEFTKYHAKDFVWGDQVRLAEWLHSMDNPILISNQATDRIIKLYSSLGFQLMTLPAPRMISCDGNRTKALEVIAARNIDKSLFASIKKRVENNAQA